MRSPSTSWHGTNTMRISVALPIKTRRPRSRWPRQWRLNKRKSLRMSSRSRRRPPLQLWWTSSASSKRRCSIQSRSWSVSTCSITWCLSWRTVFWTSASASRATPWTPWRSTCSSARSTCPTRTRPPTEHTSGTIDFKKVRMREGYKHVLLKRGKI